MNGFNGLKIAKGFMIFLALMVMIGAISTVASAATVTTDKPDYAPGEVVVITGTGWLPGETVSMILHEESQLLEPDVTLLSEADADGNIINAVWSPDVNDIGLTFTLTATGQTSGLTAQTTFTDAPQPPCTSDADCCTSGGCNTNPNSDNPFHCTGNKFNAGTACASDGNVCTSDVCDGGGACTHTAVADGTACDNSTVCDGHETCQSGTCTAGTPLNCDDNNVCTTDSCDAVQGCQHTNNTLPCDDNTVCNGREVCGGGTCNPGTPLNCDDNNVCTTDSCDAVQGCQHTNKDNGTDCDDGNKCNGISTCQTGTCTQTTPPVNCDDQIVCTDDSCDPDTGDCVNTKNDVCFSSITNSSLCLFDVDASVTSSDCDLRLIFTPDQSSWKLNASNPGQFYYNAFYFGSGSTTLDITLPYPFVTQGAVPIHIYDGVTMTTSHGFECWVPGTEIANSSTQVTLGNYSPQAFGSATTVSVDLPSLPDGFAYVNIHLDYGLKKGPTAYAKDNNNNAVTPSTSTILIPDKESYTLGDTTGGSDTCVSENSFKKDPGIGGLVVKNGTTEPVPNLMVQIYDSNKKLLATVYTDQDGWYMWQYKYTGKAATFTVKIAGTTLSQTVTLKSNGFLVVNFTLP